MTHDVNDLAAKWGSGLLTLNLPPAGPDMDWSLRADNPDGDASKLTVTINLVSAGNGVIVRRARIAVDLYGWGAVTERCRSLLKAELDERYAP